MEIDEIQQKLRECAPLLKSEYDVEQIGIFGSFVRHEQNKDSDLDLLVTFLKKPGLLKFISLENYLSNLLGVKVDLVMASALKERIWETDSFRGHPGMKKMEFLDYIDDRLDAAAKICA